MTRQKYKSDSSRTGRSLVIDMLPVRSLQIAFVIFFSLARQLFGLQANSTHAPDHDDQQVKRTNYVYPMLGGNFSKPPVVVHPSDEEHDHRDDGDQQWMYGRPGNTETSPLYGMRYQASHFPSSSVNWNSVEQESRGIQLKNETHNFDGRQFGMPVRKTQHDAAQNVQSNQIIPQKSEFANWFNERPAAIQYRRPHHRYPEAQQYGSINSANAPGAPYPPFEDTRFVKHSVNQETDRHYEHTPGTQIVSDSQETSDTQGRRPTIKDKTESSEENPAQDLDRSLIEVYRYHERQLYQRFQELCVQIRGVRCDDNSLLQSRQVSRPPTAYPVTSEIRLPGYGYRY